MTPSRKKKEDETDLTPPEQSAEAREAVLQRAPHGTGTATGLAHERLLGDQKERIEGLDSRGSSKPIAGDGQLGRDFAEGDPGQPVGAQAQVARYTTNGILPVNMVASPTGLVPVSTVTTDPAEASRLVQENIDAHDEGILRSGSRKLSRAQIEAASAADLRAVASDRGYDLGENAGQRVTRRRFIAAQNEDAEVDEGEDGVVEEDTTE